MDFSADAGLAQAFSNLRDQQATDTLAAKIEVTGQFPMRNANVLRQVLRHFLMGMISGGTNDIQRTLIAQRGLALSR